MDRATYHMELTDDAKGSHTSWNREQLATWLIARGASDETNNHIYTLDQLLNKATTVTLASGNVRQQKGMSKAFLLALAEKYKPQKKYKIFEWVKQWNGEKGTDIQVNVLPIAHPQLNPIEMVWCWLKSYVKSNNHDFSMPTIERLAKERVNQLGAEYWAKAFAKMREFADDCWTTDEQLLDESEHQIEDDDDVDGEDDEEMETA